MMQQVKRERPQKKNVMPSVYVSADVFKKVIKECCEERKVETNGSQNSNNNP